LVFRTKGREESEIGGFDVRTDPLRQLEFDFLAWKEAEEARSLDRVLVDEDVRSIV
jgi:hypothetical protein